MCFCTLRIIDLKHNHIVHQPFDGKGSAMLRRIWITLLSFIIATCANAELKRAEVKRDGDGPQGGPDSEKIAVVKTWDELRARPSIDLGDGMKVRLGVSAQSSPRCGAVLLYCLAD